MTAERDELLPCPFCGGAFKLGQEPADNHPVGGKWYLYHEYGPLDSPARKCLLSVAPHFDSATEATTAWNTRTTPSKDTGAVVRLANELRERSRFPSGVARISEAKAREIAESALSTPDPITPEHFAENANCPATPEPEIARAVEAEREACARVAEHYNFGPERTERDNARNAIAEIIARAIRARTKES